MLSSVTFNKHPNIEGLHAFLGASKYHWINYDLEKMERIFENQFAAMRGVRLHAWAAEAIRLGRRQPRDKQTLNMYINDGIGFRMTPEVVLFYSENCFCTPDTIVFNNGILRVHDLKTGEYPGSEHQLEVACAVFCLEYRINPYDIEMILRIYQYDEVNEILGDPKRIRMIMDKIKAFDRRIEEMKEVIR